MQEQNVYASVENGIVMGLYDNSWTPDIGFYADQECQKNIEANRIIKDGDIYYAGYGV